VLQPPARSEIVVTSNPLFAQWWFQVPNFVLAALMYTVLGRAILGLIFDADSPNYIWKFFCRVTDPVIAIFRPVTPKATVPVVLWLFSFVWLFWLRVLLLNVFLWFGALPPAS
jgi:YggT family protein